MLNAEPIIGQEARREIRPKSTMSLIGVVLAGLLLRTVSRDSRALRLAIRNCRDTATLHAVVIGPLAKSAIVREWATQPPFASSS